MHVNPEIRDLDQYHAIGDLFFILQFDIVYLSMVLDLLGTGDLDYWKPIRYEDHNFTSFLHSDSDTTGMSTSSTNASLSGGGGGGV